jgi:hypothetical protein
LAEFLFFEGNMESPDIGLEGSFLDAMLVF